MYLGTTQLPAHTLEVIIYTANTYVGICEEKKNPRRLLNGTFTKKLAFVLR